MQSMLALHLLQNGLVYIRALMLQQILARPHWHGAARHSRAGAKYLRAAAARPAMGLMRRRLKATRFEMKLMWQHTEPG